MKNKRRWLGLGGVLLAAGLLLWQWWANQRREHSQDAVIWEAAQRYGIDPALIKAVIWRESRFNARARGPAGEIGLMQVRAPAAREWAAHEGNPHFQTEALLDPRQNAFAGAWYLKKLLARYRTTDHPAAYALADYNAGRRNVLRWNHGAAATNHLEFLKQLDFPLTRRYVQSVLKRAQRYHDEFRAFGQTERWLHG